MPKIALCTILLLLITLHSGRADGIAKNATDVIMPDEHITQEMPDDPSESSLHEQREDVAIEPPPAKTPITYRGFAMAGYGDGSSWAGGTGLGLSFSPITTWQKAGQLTPGIEFTSTYWSGRRGNYNIRRMHDVGATAMLRWESREPHRGLFLEGGFGIHRLSETRFYTKNLGRHTQAGSNIAIGYHIPRTSLELSIRGRHLSNAGTNTNNSGINQLVARLAYRF